MALGLITLASTIISGITGHFKRKQEVKNAVAQNKIRLAADQQSHNHEWEMKQLENVGWKDDVLFYGFIAMFIWAGFDPEGARQFFVNLQVLPTWFIKTWLWLVASVVGVKKVGEYAPDAIKAIKDVFKK